MDQATATSAMPQAMAESELVRLMGDYIPPRTDLVAILQYWAQKTPDRIAFYFTDGENGDDDLQVTFKELDAQARNLAGYLQNAGVNKGERVLLIYPPVLDFVAGFFGCLYAGATAVPAFPPRRNRKGQRIHGIAKDCQANVALTTQTVRQQIEGDANWVEWESVSIIASDSMAKDYTSSWTPPNLNSDDLAVLQYTSGSTGNPKGVMLSHGNLIRNAELIMYSFEHARTAVGVSWLPTYHDMGLIGGIVEPIWSGCSGGSAGLGGSG
ncbi:MAG: AMP-binding protein [Planctomycetota bacterium]